MIDEKFAEKLVFRAMEEGVLRHVVAAVIADEENRVLLLERPASDFFGGFYELPSGKVEKGESLLQALRREVKEETNLDVSHVKGYLGHFDYLSKRGIATRQFNFHVKTKDIRPVVLREHSSHIWISLEGLENCRITDKVKKVLRKFWGVENGS